MNTLRHLGDFVGGEALIATGYGFPSEYLKKGNIPTLLQPFTHGLIWLSPVRQLSQTQNRQIINQSATLAKWLIGETVPESLDDHEAIKAYIQLFPGITTPIIAEAMYGQWNDRERAIRRVNNVLGPLNNGRLNIDTRPSGFGRTLRLFLHGTEFGSSNLRYTNNTHYFINEYLDRVRTREEKNNGRYIVLHKDEINFIEQHGMTETTFWRTQKIVQGLFRQGISGKRTLFKDIVSAAPEVNSETGVRRNRENFTDTIVGEAKKDNNGPLLSYLRYIGYNSMIVQAGTERELRIYDYKPEAHFTEDMYKTASELMVTLIKQNILQSRNLSAVTKSEVGAQLREFNKNKKDNNREWTPLHRYTERKRLLESIVFCEPTPEIEAKGAEEIQRFQKSLDALAFIVEAFDRMDELDIQSAGYPTFLQALTSIAPTINTQQYSREELIRINNGLVHLYKEIM
jgi:hypothetical protein